MAEVELKFENAKRSGIVAVGTYLFDGARRLGVEVPAECGRRGECESCLMTITEGGEFLSAPTAAEIKQLGEERIEAGERLSCQTKLEKAGEIVIMITQKNEENKPETEEEKTAQYRKEFEEMPLEKKISSLVELEAIALGETFSFVLNSPYLIFGKIMDVMAEFGLKLEAEDKQAKRPQEHKKKEKFDIDEEIPSVKNENKSKSATKKESSKNATEKTTTEKNASEKNAGGEESSK